MNVCRVFSRRFTSTPTIGNECKTTASSSRDNRQSGLLRRALHPQLFPYVDSLTEYVKKNISAHEPGRFVVIPKPYGVSCVGHAQEGGGVFKNSVHDEEKRLRTQKNTEASKNDGVTLEDCLQELRRALREPKLDFCVGLKRYLSGAIVLTCSDKDFGNLKHSIRSSDKTDVPYHYRAIAITLNKPENSEGSINGFATFRSVGTHKEYVFEEKKASRRAKSGKFAVSGSMDYRVLDSKNGCSLVEFGIDKFARHLPRLMLTSLGSPILGDNIYARRLIDVDGAPVVASSKNLNSIRNSQLWTPRPLLSKLSISRDQFYTSLPMYCHVYSTVFPNFGSTGEHLVAAAPPPPHFLAMVDVLGMRHAFRKFLSETDNDDVDY